MVNLLYKKEAWCIGYSILGKLTFQARANPIWTLNFKNSKGADVRYCRKFWGITINLSEVL
jgi:hypothetical protein